MTNIQHLPTHVPITSRKAITHRTPDAYKPFVEKPLLLKRPLVQRAIAILLKGEEDVPSEWEFTGEEWQQIRFRVERLKYPKFLARYLDEAFMAMKPKILTPRVLDDTAAIVEAWSQPEGQAVWQKWWDDRLLDRHRPAYEASKGALLSAAWFGSGEFKHGHSTMMHNVTIKALFQRLAGSTDRYQARPERAPLMLSCYEGTTTMIGRISSAFPPVAMEACVGIVRALQIMYPKLGIGEFGAVDGTPVCAWTKQDHAVVDGVVDNAREDFLRRRMPNAAYRAYIRTINGKKNVKGQSVKNAWRGFLFILIVDVVTGLPLVGQFVPATTNETHVLRDLLDTLYKYWPDSPMKALVADKLWDTKAAHLTCERHYGIHLVAIRQPRGAKAKPKRFVEGSHKLIKKVDGLGQATCRKHGNKLDLGEVSVPSREGLLPGEADDKADALFRYRYVGCCGKPSVRMDLNPAAMPYYPHHPNGRPRRYAERRALEAFGRNQSEAAFSSLKSSGLAVAGSARMRSLNEDNVHAAIWAQLLNRSLLTLASERQFAAEAEQLKAAA